MSLWIIHPRDPLIFRDGKPFTANPGERSKSLAFPFPSTLAGAVRTMAGTEKGINFNDPEQSKQIEGLKDISVRGPILAEINEGDSVKYFFPAPADALLVEDRNKQVIRHRLKPLKTTGGAKTDLVGPNLVGPSTHVKDKPYTKAPPFWNWGEMQKWLIGISGWDPAPESLGFSGPVREQRTHVSIEPGTQVSVEGALFQTSGIEFTRVDLNDEERMKSAHSLVLTLDTEADLQEGADFLGGERRVIRWQKTKSPFPKCPDEVRKNIADKKYCRVILGTPAFFDWGHIPTHLESGFGIKVSVQGAALSRYQTISGWDYDKRAPKPTYRLVPAGSVYFLKLEGDPTRADVDKFIDAIWLHAISDGEQWRKDGFGLALLGTWDGNIREMEVNS